MLTLIPANGAPGVVSAEGRLETCSWDIGGPAPDGFWIFSGGQRLLNVAVFVPPGRCSCVAAARWRRWALVTVPLGLALLAAYSRRHRVDPARAGPHRPGLRRHRRRRQRHRRAARRARSGWCSRWCCGPGAAASGASAALAWRHGPPSAAPQRPADPDLRARQAADGPAGDDGVQAVEQREPLPAAARRGRGGDARGRGDEPLPRHGQHGAVRRPRGPARRAGDRPRRWRPAASR